VLQGEWIRGKELMGVERSDAERAGFRPYSYQAIKWFTFLFLPVVPLGTYRVLKVKQDFWTMDAPQYSMVSVSWDWAQVARHYLIGYCWILVPLAILVVADLFDGP
jgi:hypothetical protein